MFACSTAGIYEFEKQKEAMISIALTKRGLHWKRSNAIAVVALCVQVINADWEATAVEYPIVGGTKTQRSSYQFLSDRL
jgi:hypothetical protein